MDKFLNLPLEKQISMIDAALLSFGSNGYKKTSVSDIAAAAGISKAMVFHYFGTKKDLYLYLIQYCYDHIMIEINNKFDNSITDFFDRILLSSEIKLSVLKKHPATISFLSNVHFEQAEDVKEDIKAILDQSEDVRNKIAFDGMDTTKFKDEVDPQLVMKILTWMAEGLSSNSKSFTANSLEALTQEFYECMKLLKNNLYKEEFLK